MGIISSSYSYKTSELIENGDQEKINLSDNKKIKQKSNKSKPFIIL